MKLVKRVDKGQKYEIKQAALSLENLVFANLPDEGYETGELSSTTDLTFYSEKDINPTTTFIASYRQEPSSIEERIENLDREVNEPILVKEESKDEKKVHPLALLSMILGILSIPTLCLGFILLGEVGLVGLILGGGAIVMGILSIILGSIAAKRIKEDPDNLRGRGFYQAGIFTSTITLGMVAILTLLILLISSSY